VLLISIQNIIALANVVFTFFQTKNIDIRRHFPVGTTGAEPATVKFFGRPLKLTPLLTPGRHNQDVPTMP
jgi:hypothetical protein